MRRATRGIERSKVSSDIRRAHTVDDDLVIVDLGGTGPPGSGPLFDRRAFEDRYAELAFGLGTVPRRVHDDDSLMRRPGVVLFLVVAIVGAFALGRADHAGRSPTPTGAAGLAVLTASTHASLVLEHVERFTVLDVDRATLREVAPGAIASDRAADSSPAPVVVDAVSQGGDRYALIAHRPDGPRRVTADGLLLTAGPHLVVWRPYLCSRTCPLRVTDVRTGATRTVERFDPRGGTRVVLSPDERTLAVFEGEPDGARGRMVGLGRHPRSRSFRPRLNASTIVWSRDSRWAFATNGLELVALGRDGTLGRVDVILPPFEGLTAR